MATNVFETDGIHSLLTTNSLGVITSSTQLDSLGYTSGVISSTWADTHATVLNTRALETVINPEILAVKKSVLVVNNITTPTASIGIEADITGGVGTYYGMNLFNNTNANFGITSTHPYSGSVVFDEEGGTNTTTTAIKQGLITITDPSIPLTTSFNATTLTSGASSQTWANIISPILKSAIIQETRPTNTNSAVVWTPSSSLSVIRPRQFNAKTEAGLSITLGGSPNFTFTIPLAGTYQIEANAYFSSPPIDGQTVFSKMFLNNQTLGLGAVIVGDSNRYGPINNSNSMFGSNIPCFLNGIVAISGITVFSLDHHIRSDNAAPTGGFAVNMGGSIEIYATLKITKLA